MNGGNPPPMWPLGMPVPGPDGNIPPSMNLWKPTYDPSMFMAPNSMLNIPVIIPMPPPTRISPPPVPEVKGNKYFLVKSSLEENIKISQHYNVWHTSKTWSSKIHSSIFHSNNITLFFFTHQKYLGHAIVTSSIHDVPVTCFRSNEGKVLTANSFSVQWMSKVNIPVSCLSCVYYNKDEVSINFCPDGTELSLPISHQIFAFEKTYNANFIAGEATIPAHQTANWMHQYLTRAPTCSACIANNANNPSCAMCINNSNRLSQLCEPINFDVTNMSFEDFSQCQNLMSDYINQKNENQLPPSLQKSFWQKNLLHSLMYSD